MTDAANLIAGDDLKATAYRFVDEMRAKIERRAKRPLEHLRQLVYTGRDPPHQVRSGSLLGGQRARKRLLRSPAQDQSLPWDLHRLRLFLDRWQQGRFVEYGRREQSGAHYHPRFGTEFGIDVLLTCQGAPSLMRWRGMPLMKNVFDFAIYPALIAELRPQTVFEVGSGWAPAPRGLPTTWHCAGVEGRVHSVDLVKAAAQASGGQLLSRRLLRSGTAFRSRSAALGAASLAGRRRRASQRCRGTRAVSRLPAAGRLSGGRRQ